MDYLYEDETTRNDDGLDYLNPTAITEKDIGVDYLYDEKDYQNLIDNSRDKMKIRINREFKSMEQKEQKRYRKTLKVKGFSNKKIKSLLRLKKKGKKKEGIIC